MSAGPNEHLARLPQVDAVLRALGDGVHGHRLAAQAARGAIDAARSEILAGGDAPRFDAVVADAEARLAAHGAGRLRGVVNATGVVLHTNLGRAPLSAAAREAVSHAGGYTSLEYDLERGGRGSRTAYLGELTAQLCSTPAATVVNNGAAALLLALSALGAGREVIVSRGELVEIGGSYRLPDVMSAAGARLVEVGTTNRTRIADYRSALGEETALLLKVHRSNFAIVGFTEETGVDELAELGREHGVPVVHDLGSGLIEATAGAFAAEPNVRSSVRQGADLVIFSGDKLLGGPQAGMIAGMDELVRRCEQHPLSRAVRVDKLQRAALEATLDAHLRGASGDEIPTIAMLHADVDGLRSRAERIADALGAVAVETSGAVGGGTAPGVELPSWGIRIDAGDPDAFAARLRGGEPAVVARIESDAVILDVRAVDPVQDDVLIERVEDARG